MAHAPQRGSGRGRIVILGWYGSNNTGDEAVLQAVVESLRKHGLNDLYVLSTNPGKTSREHGVEAASRTPSLASLMSLRGARALVLGGGGLIQDGSSVYNLPIYALYVAVASLFHVPVIAWGLGVESLSTLMGRWLARFICRAATYFSVRDNGAKRLLVRSGAPAERIRVTADPAFLISSEQDVTQRTKTRPTAIFCVRHLPDDRPGLNLQYLLPVSMRHRLGLRWSRAASREELLVRAIASGVRVCALELGAEIAFLPLWPGRDDEILAAVERAALALGVPASCMRWADVEQTPERVAAYIAGAELVVSMRLHALIFAAAGGVPVLALSYVRKVTGLMRLLDSERWTVEVGSRTPAPEEIEAKLRELWAVRGRESRRLSSGSDRLRERAESDALRIARLLGSSEPAEPR